MSLLMQWLYWIVNVFEDFLPLTFPAFSLPTFGVFFCRLFFHIFWLFTDIKWVQYRAVNWYLDWIIFIFFNRICIDVHPPLLCILYSVQMPFLMYLIFSKKQRITFFDPLYGQVGWTLFYPERIKILPLTLPPFSRADTSGLPRWLTRVYLNCLAHFWMSSVPAAFPPQIKCISFASRKPGARKQFPNVKVLPRSVFSPDRSLQLLIGQTPWVETKPEVFKK